MVFKRKYPFRAKSKSSKRTFSARKRRRYMSKTVKPNVDSRQNQRIRSLESMIETKEGCFKTSTNLGLSHNNISVIGTTTSGQEMNPFATENGTSDPMDATIGKRIGDQISVRGVLFKAFFENALGRARVHYRVMLIRKAKQDGLTRATLFKGNCDNKTIDQINTERYTIVAQKKFTIDTSNSAALTVGLTGVPATGTPAGVGTRAFQMWIPGRKFGKNGLIKYENGSGTQVKFYDYRFVIYAYDWYGTPQDANDVGKLNEAYCKLYFKDA